METNKTSPVTPELREKIMKDAEPIKKLANELYKKYSPPITGLRYEWQMIQDEDGSFDRSGMYLTIEIGDKSALSI